MGKPCRNGLEISNPKQHEEYRASVKKILLVLVFL